MKIAINWLKEYIVLTEEAHEIAQLLTQHGLEVENITQFAPLQDSLHGLLIGQIITCEKHPQADRLKKLRVDIGNQTPLAIICGAPTVALGQKVVVAPIGVQLCSTQGTHLSIQKVKIRGEISEGMLCTEEEIGIGNSHEGIIVLDTPLPPGTSVAAYYTSLTDTILEIEPTPNRGDACSHIGVARELRAILKRSITYPPIANLQLHTAHLPIHIVTIDHEACPRYSGITLCGVTVQPSPLWLQHRLQAIGVKPINTVVDVTNFVLHELGQPLHAFDYDQIVGKQLSIQKPPTPTTLVTLDDQERTLFNTDLLVCDQAGSLCIAGILGGKRASIHAGTQNIFLESAYFNPITIQKTAQHHALKTEASFRYERGTDPNLTVYALQRACALLQEITQCQIASPIIDYYPNKIEHTCIKVYYANMTRLIGQSIPKATIYSILAHLDITISQEEADSFTAHVPPYRVGVTREVDLIEEIVRLYGYDTIALAEQHEHPFQLTTDQPEKHTLVTQLGDLLLAQGYYEICTLPLTSATYSEQAHLDVEQQTIPLLNPWNQAYNTLRPSLVYAGLEALATNIHRKQPDVKLFEFGKVYYKKEKQYRENYKLGIWLTGTKEAATWIRKPGNVTFQDLNATLYQILYKLGVTAWIGKPIQHPYYQKSMQVLLDNSPLLTAGELNRSLLHPVSINQPVFFAEIDWDVLFSKLPRHQPYQPLSKFPTVTRDLSLVLDQSITFQQVKNSMAQQPEPRIQAVTVIDTYTGPQIGIGKKAYTLRFILQDPDKTLDEKDIDQVMTRLIETFTNYVGAIIRT